MMINDKIKSIPIKRELEKTVDMFIDLYKHWNLTSPEFYKHTMPIFNLTVKNSTGEYVIVSDEFLPRILPLTHFGVFVVYHGLEDTPYQLFIDGTLDRNQLIDALYVDVSDRFFKQMRK